MASNLLLSYELIALMEWLLSKEEEELKSLIKKALNNGLAGKIHTVSTVQNMQSNDALHNTFLDFILNLEDLLVECLEEEAANRPLQEHLFAKLQGMNVTRMDSQTMWSSIRAVENELTSRISSENEKKVRSAKPQEEAKLLHKQLLENWEPEEQEDVN